MGTLSDKPLEPKDLYGRVDAISYDDQSGSEVTDTGAVRFFDNDNYFTFQEVDFGDVTKSHVVQDHQCRGLYRHHSLQGQQR